MPFLFPFTFLLQQSGAEQGLPRKTMVADDLVESFARCHHLPAILLSGSVVTSEWRAVLTHAQAFQEDGCTQEVCEVMRTKPLSNKLASAVDCTFRYLTLEKALELVSSFLCPPTPPSSFQTQTRRYSGNRSSRLSLHLYALNDFFPKLLYNLHISFSYPLLTLPAAI